MISRKDTLLNPTLLVEVLSKSTASYDRGEKFEHYRKLASLTEYLVIAQNKYHVEHYQRQLDNRWLLSETEDKERCSRTKLAPSFSCCDILRQ